MGEGRGPDESERRAAAWQLLIATVRYGEMLGAAIAARAEDPSMVHNAPIAVITELALRGSRRPSQLVTFTGLTSGGVTKMVDRLVEGGLVDRAIGEVARDRRAVTIRLTERGQRLAAIVADAVIEQVSLLRAVEGEMTALLDLLDDDVDVYLADDEISRRRPPARPDRSSR